MRTTRMRAAVMTAILVRLSACSGGVRAWRVVGFNMELGGARPDVVDNLIQAAQGVVRWGFSEIHDEIWATLCEQAAEDGETPISNALRASPAAIGSAACLTAIG